MSWSGSWKGDVYEGEYTFDDGSVFKGEARAVDTHTITHTTPDGYTKVVSHPVEPHYEFTGTWVAEDGTAGFPAMPPAPERS
jgi:hypothetical protein